MPVELWMDTLLLALCAAGRRTFMVAERFDRAVLEAAQRTAQAGKPLRKAGRWVTVDPMFGDVAVAHAALTRAIGDRTITWQSSCIARFTCTPAQAAQTMVSLLRDDYAKLLPWFTEAGRTIHARLSAPAPVRP